MSARNREESQTAATRTGRLTRFLPVPLLCVLSLVALALAIPPTTGAATSLPSTITEDMTWTAAGSPYTSTGSVTIASGVTVTAEPGATVKIGGTSSSLIVNGTLNAQGTAANPILFTSTADSGTHKWRGLSFETGSGASVLDHVEIRTGGYQSYGAITVNAGSPTITNSNIHDNGGNGVTIADGAPEIAYNTLTGGKSGIYAYSTSGAKIHDNTVEQNDHYGIWISGSATTLRDNTIKDNGSGCGVATCPGLRFFGTDNGIGPIPPDIDENTISGNDVDDIYVYGTLEESASWKSDLPFTGELAIAQGATLTPAPGFVFKTSGTTSSVVVNGTLNAQGTAANPILFTSTADSGTHKWRGLSFETGSGASVLDHVEIRTGGYQSYGAITVNAGSPTITNSNIHDNGGSGITLYGGSPTIKRSTIHDNGGQGFYVSGDSTPLIKWNSIFGHQNYGVYYTGPGILFVPHNYWGCLSGAKPAGCGDFLPPNVIGTPAATNPTEDGQCQGRVHQCGKGGDPVSMATGALTYEHTDLSLPNESNNPLAFTRAYNSGDDSDSGLGPGWAHTALAHAGELESEDVLITRSDGRQDTFTKVTGGYDAPSGITDTLEKKADGTFKLTTLGRTIYEFEDTGRIAKITDDHGLTTTYGYDSNDRLASLTDASGQRLTFTYDASNHITKVTDSTAAR